MTIGGSSEISYLRRGNGLGEKSMMLMDLNGCSWMLMGVDGC